MHVGQADHQARPPVLELSKRWLTISLIAVTLVPMLLAATVWLAIPSTPEPELPVEVHFEPVSWPPEPSGHELRSPELRSPEPTSDVRLMPGVRLHNPTGERWTNLSMGINNQFYFYCPEPLEAGGDFRVPLALFRTSGNQAYRPTSVRIKKLTVYAQLPSGRRAIREIREPAQAARRGTVGQGRGPERAALLGGSPSDR